MCETKGYICVYLCDLIYNHISCTSTQYTHYNYQNCVNPITYCLSCTKIGQTRATKIQLNKYHVRDLILLSHWYNLTMFSFRDSLMIMQVVEVPFHRKLFRQFLIPLILVATRLSYYNNHSL